MDSRIRLAKCFCSCIASKSELYKIIGDIPLADEDRKLVESLVIEKKTVTSVATTLNMSEATVKRHSRDFYLKLYDRLFTGYYKNNPDMTEHLK